MYVFMHSVLLQPQLLTWGGRMWPPERLMLSERNTHIQCCFFCSLRFLWGQIMDTRSACSHIYTNTAGNTLPLSKSGIVNNVSSTLVIILSWQGYIRGNLVVNLVGVTPNSWRFDASIGGAWFDYQSHSRIFAKVLWNEDHAILAIWGCSNVWFHIELPVFSQ